MSYGRSVSLATAVNAPSPKSVKIYKYAYSKKHKRWVYKGKVTPKVRARSATYGTGPAKVPVLRKGKWKLVARHSLAGRMTYSNTVYVRVR